MTTSRIDPTVAFAAFLALSLGGLGLLWQPPSALAAKANRVCLRSCKTVQTTCTRAARSAQATSRATCTGVADARRCRQDVKHLSKAGRSVCRNARVRCRACCRAGRTPCDVPPEVPRFAGTFPIPDRRGLEQTPLPPGPNGQGFMLLELPDGAFFFDPAARSPVSAAAECATVILSCFDPTQRNWAGCFASVPSCETDTPWVGDHPMCCPAACAERYQSLRAAGRSDPAAFAAAIWEAPSCMPALAGHEPEGAP